jgi:hypothetical protein
MRFAERANVLSRRAKDERTPAERAGGRPADVRVPGAVFRGQSLAAVWSALRSALVGEPLPI